MKCTNLAAVLKDVSHVMLKMIIDDSAFLFNQREKALPFSESAGYFAL